MKLITAEKMRALEKEYFESYGMPSAALMEAAAISVYRHCAAYLAGFNGSGVSVVVVCGKGNNGGDGFAVARYLAADGVSVKIFATAGEAALTGDALINFRLANKTGIPIRELNESKPSIEEFRSAISHAGLVVDALLGTGLSSKVTGVYAKVIEEMNARARHIISVDIPSGLNPDSGHPMGICVRAKKTVTLGLPKQGLYIYPGYEYCGEIVLEPIGLPRTLTDGVEAESEILTEAEIFDRLPVRHPRSNKSTYGSVYLFGGCQHMPGAAVLCASAAYKAGAGIVKVCACRSVAEVVHNRLPEAVTAILPDKNGRLCAQSYEGIRFELEKADTVVAGPGLGFYRDVGEFVERLIQNTDVPMVLDADALNVISWDVSALSNIKKLSVLTPHPGEMSRLLAGEKEISEILDAPVTTAKEFSKKYNVVTVLKDANTVVASPDGRVYINTTGCPAMAKAGSGDVLSGIIAAMLAQKKDPFTAAVIGTYIHGRAGERASQKFSTYGVSATDLIDSIPAAMLKNQAEI